MDEMIFLTRAVTRGARRGRSSSRDMPFGSFQVSTSRRSGSAIRFVKESAPTP
jgi:ketopantoate hydroxymethyltransferase